MSALNCLLCVLGRDISYSHRFVIINVNLALLGVGMVAPVWLDRKDIQV